MASSSKSGPEKRVITKGVFSLEKSLESLKSLDSLESLRYGRILLCFPLSGGSLESLESLNSLESLEKDFSERPLFQKTPFSEPDQALLFEGLFAILTNRWVSEEHICV